MLHTMVILSANFTNTSHLEYRFQDIYCYSSDPCGKQIFSKVSLNKRYFFKVSVYICANKKQLTELSTIVMIHSF